MPVELTFGIASSVHTVEERVCRLNRILPTYDRYVHESRSVQVPQARLTSHPPQQRSLDHLETTQR